MSSIEKRPLPFVALTARSRRNPRPDPMWNPSSESIGPIERAIGAYEKTFCISSWMEPMLSEEGFHIGSGRGFLKELALGALSDNGRYSMDDIQRALNAWIPRGLEMFGNERGGETAIAFGFKDRTNGTAQSEYYNEVREVLELVNVEIVKTKIKDISAPDARSVVREVQDTGERVRDIAPEDLLFAPDVKFFRARGAEDVVFMPYDVYGTLLTDDGKPAGGEKYLTYLKSVLPEHYHSNPEFGKYVQALLGREAPMPGRSYGW